MDALLVIFVLLLTEEQLSAGAAASALRLEPESAAKIIAALTCGEVRAGGANGKAPHRLANAVDWSVCPSVTFASDSPISETLSGS